MEKLKKLQVNHHYIVDWHIPTAKKDNKEQDTQNKKNAESEKIFIDYGHYTKKD